MTDKLKRVKLVLDKSAVERLIGDDPEIEIALTQGAVAWLRDRRVKPSLDCTMNELRGTIDHAVRERVCKELGAKVEVVKRGGWPTIYVARPNVVKAIEEGCRVAVQNEITTQVGEQITKQQEWFNERLKGYKTRCDELLEKYTAEMTAKLTDSVVDQKIRAAVVHVMSNGIGKGQ